MSSDTRDLTGTVVVVTGAGSGIGAAIARGLVDLGARVVLVDLRSDAARRLAAELGAECTEVVAGDAGDPAVAEAAIRAGAERWGRVDSVVANAGLGRFGGLLEHTNDEIVAMSETNFLGTVWLARAAVEHFRSRERGGDIVVMSSAAGLGHGGGSEAVYAATKAAWNPAVDPWLSSAPSTDGPLDNQGSTGWKWGGHRDGPDPPAAPEPR